MLENEESFLDWIDELVEANPHLSWEWIVGTLVNDEVSTNEELAQYLMQEVDVELTNQLLAKRTEFLNYGLDIQI